MNPAISTLLVVIMACLILLGFAWHDQNSKGT